MQAVAPPLDGVGMCSLPQGLGSQALDVSRLDVIGTQMFTPAPVNPG